MAVHVLGAWNRRGFVYQNNHGIEDCVITSFVELEKITAKVRVSITYSLGYLSCCLYTKKIEGLF